MRTSETRGESTAGALRDGSFNVSLRGLALVQYGIDGGEIRDEFAVQLRIRSRRELIVLQPDVCELPLVDVIVPPLPGQVDITSQLPHPIDDFPGWIGRLRRRQLG